MAIAALAWGGCGWVGGWVGEGEGEARFSNQWMGPQGVGRGTYDSVTGLVWLLWGH
jgi:hypothetical protein